MKQIILRTILFISIIGAWVQTKAQQASIKGSVTDTVNYKPMAYSAVSLIRPNGILVKTQFTKTDNAFLFDQILPDTYTLQITRMGYADYEERFILKEGELKDFGIIALISKENLLREVLVKDRSAIKIKGDTTEFLVDSFLTNKNSNIEDLLKKLPGIQVDKSGKITAQGQEVKKVLVDGEEFFGNDPTIATKNIKAENVETVQVFDQKSEQTQQTGIDDGTKEKTINLTLKEDAKKGYFGKVGAGYGTKNQSGIDGVSANFGNENRYEGEAMYNNFKNKRKASVFSTFSNTNKTGLNWEDREKYMGGNNVEYDEANGYMYSTFEYDENGFNGNGIPVTNYIGANYSDKILKEKLTYNFNASRKEMLVNGIDRNYTQYILPDTMYFNRQDNRIKTNRITNASSGKAVWNIDSLSTFTVKASVNQSIFNNDNEYSSQNLNSLSQKVNENIRTNTNTGQTLTANYSLFYNKKFKKLGRSFSINFDQRINKNNSDGNLLSDTKFFNGDSSIRSEQKLDQIKNSSEEGNHLGARVTYTEPLSKTWSISSDYDYHITLNKSFINTFNKSASGQILTRVDSLSNHLDYNIGINKGGISFRYITKKVNASFGARISHTLLSQTNRIQDTTLYQDFLNLFPTASFNYKLGSTKSINLSYSGSTRQPTLQQINPIQDLSNPLVIFRGNPQLEQRFSNDVNLSFNHYQPISGKSFYANIRYNYTFNDFANSDQVDEQGRRVYKTVNVDGNQYISSYAYYYFKINALNLGLNQSISPYFNKNANFINGLSNTNKNFDITYDISLSFEKEEKFEIYFSPSISYNYSTTTLRPDVVTEFFTYYLDFGSEFMLPKKFSLEFNADWNIRQKTAVFNTNNNVLIINAQIAKKFGKNDDFNLRLGVSDLLNQNIGFRRTANSNYINENTHIVLRRYFMIGLTYNFQNGRN
ncbi:MAG: TonB-dependent receptor family protein [Bacteroidia bacterium]|nr:TonB-dependent receptor family protein [Bacteroidia bacterium]